MITCNNEKKSFMTCLFNNQLTNNCATEKQNLQQCTNKQNAEIAWINCDNKCINILKRGQACNSINDKSTRQSCKSNIQAQSMECFNICLTNMTNSSSSSPSSQQTSSGAGKEQLETNDGSTNCPDGFTYNVEIGVCEFSML